MSRAKSRWEVTAEGEWHHGLACHFAGSLKGYKTIDLAKWRGAVSFSEQNRHPRPPTRPLIRGANAGASPRLF